VIGIAEKLIEQVLQTNGSLHDCLSISRLDFLGDGCVFGMQAK